MGADMREFRNAGPQTMFVSPGRNTSAITGKDFKVGDTAVSPTNPGDGWTFMGVKPFGSGPSGGITSNWRFDGVKPAAQPQAAPAPAPPAAPAPEQRVDTIGANAPSPNKPKTDFGGSGSGAFGDKPRDDDEGYLDSYLNRENSDYKQWWADRAPQNAENQANSSDWSRYFRDEYKKGEPNPTFAKDHETKSKRWRMAGGGDFLTGINGFLGNYSKADSA